MGFKEDDLSNPSCYLSIRNRRFRGFPFKIRGFHREMTVLDSFNRCFPLINEWLESFFIGSNLGYLFSMWTGDCSWVQTET